MIKEICDVCQKNDADKRYKIKQSAKCYMTGAAHLDRIWSPYEKIVICNECAEKLFSVSLRAKSPGHKKCGG